MSVGTFREQSFGGDDRVRGEESPVKGEQGRYDTTGRGSAKEGIIARETLVKRVLRRVRAPAPEPSPRGTLNIEMKVILTDKEFHERELL